MSLTPRAGRMDDKTSAKRQERAYPSAYPVMNADMNEMITGCVERMMLIVSGYAVGHKTKGKPTRKLFRDALLD